MKVAAPAAINMQRFTTDVADAAGELKEVDVLSPVPRSRPAPPAPSRSRPPQCQSDNSPQRVPITYRKATPEYLPCRSARPPRS
jgi:hypothetical protein